MAWLTDSDRREADWLDRVQELPRLVEYRTAHLPTGGMRFEWTALQGDVEVRQEIEDVAMGQRTIDRILRGQATRGRARTRWLVKERITVEFQGDATQVTARALGRPVGKSLARHLLGINETATARALTAQATQWTDFVVASVTGHFGQADGIC